MQLPLPNLDENKHQAVSSLGTLLLKCHPLWLRPNASLIEAAIEGYCQHRFLTTRELDALFDALCFVPAIGGAWQIIDTVEGAKSEEE